MKKFTPDDMQKKHETNIKTAVTAMLLSGVLGLIFLVRYLFKRNLDFYFSLSFTEGALMLYENDSLSSVITVILIAVFLTVFLLLFILSLKNQKWFIPFTGLYIFDLICLIIKIFFLDPKPLNSDCFIDVIFHLFIILFMIVGIYSHKKMSKEKTDKA